MRRSGKVEIVKSGDHPSLGELRMARTKKGRRVKVWKCGTFIWRGCLVLALAEAIRAHHYNKPSDSN